MFRSFAAMALALAVPAHAEWYQASSRHFLIYSEQKPAVLRSFAEKLEKFDSAARQARGMSDLPPSAGNRLTIFVLPSEKDVRRLIGDKSGFVAGFYKGRAAGSVAYVPRKMDSDTNASDISVILLHEYAHHLMYQDLTSPCPEWLVEGFAEFMSTAKFERDGSVGLGLPATDRAYGLFRGDNLSFESLLASSYDKISVAQRESIYGRGWLMTHYFTFEPSRKGQLDAYVKALARGATPLAAAQTAFGDLKKLEHDLDAYLTRKRMSYLPIPASMLNIGPITVSPLTAGASQAIPFLAEIRNDADTATAAGLAAKLREVEKAHPGDPFVETALAEAELAADRPALAEAAADRALTANAQSTDAMILKGRARVENLANDPKSTPAMYTDARTWFLKANKADPEDPEPLFEFYASFVREGIEPTANAIAALHYASDLAPQDGGLRMTSAALYVYGDKPKQARTALVPIAYDPHGGDIAIAARKMIERIDANDKKGALRAAGWSPR